MASLKILCYFYFYKLVANLQNICFSKLFLESYFARLTSSIIKWHIDKSKAKVNSPGQSTPDNINLCLKIDFKQTKQGSKTAAKPSGSRIWLYFGCLFCLLKVTKLKIEKAEQTNDTFRISSFSIYFQ